VRTTLDIDDDVLEAAKDLATNRGTTAGKVLSDLARQALEPRRSPRLRNGVPLLVRRPGGGPTVPAILSSGLKTGLEPTRPLTLFASRTRLLWAKLRRHINLSL
jgi:hypothetical protein